jgi:predicted dehydrogenase
VVEKPMAMTLSDAEAMLETAKQEGQLLAVFHNRHWDPDYQLLKDIINQGFVGDLMTIDSRVMTYGPEWANYGVPEFNAQWRTQAAFGGGFLSDWGPHLVEQVLDLLGEWPQSVFCQLRGQVWSEEVDDYFFVRLEFPSGKLVTLEASNNSRTPLPRWFVTGTEGTLVAKGEWGHWEDMQIRTTAGDIPINVFPQASQMDSAVSDYDVGEELSFQFYDNLAQAIAASGQLTITAERARDVMVILESARQSHASNQQVSLPKPLASYK